MTKQYNAPPGVPSSVGPQIVNEYYQKQALIEARKEQYFSQLANVTTMPKNMGKKIKLYHYIPMLDNQNLNDQGIDANGVTITGAQRYVTFPATTFAVTNATKAAAAAAVNANIDNNGVAAVIATAGADGSAGVGFATISLTKTQVKYATQATADAVVALNAGVTVQTGSGNLYGSSKDIGAVSGKLPALSETGGRVNRVGFKRKELEGTFEKFGYFDEYTKDSLDFDSDADLYQHINREMINGANEITEDALQIDLLTSAGVVRYAGAATNNVTINDTVVSYGDLMRLSIDLDNNRTPKQTTVITGTRMVDTKTIPSGRVMYVGSELLPTLKAMKDLHNNPAFISVEKYASGTTTLTGEVGAIDQFRIVVVPEMMKWAGAGADSSGTSTCYETNNHYDVFPMLCVGEASFTTIGFQTDGKGVKFNILHKAPGEATADRNDPYGETGFTSIKWFYGFMVLRPERLGLIKTAAKL
jgi:N4-gp56 family major capsid protein